MKTQTEVRASFSPWRRVLVLALIGVTVQAAVPAPEASTGRHQDQQQVQQQIDECMTVEMQYQGIPGATLAVVIDGELAYEQGYGVKSLASGEPVDSETIFRFGSIGKMMTAAGIMMQVERGAVELDRPIVDWIPELNFQGPYPTEAITVRQLLAQTSGLQRDIPSESCGQDENALSDWAAGLGDTALGSPAGAFHRYSNAGYNLAGLVAERASGVPYQEYMKEQLWQPAGMHSTTSYPADVFDAGNYSMGHFVNPETGQLEIVAPDDVRECWWETPSGHSFSTAGDLARFAMLLMDSGGALLSEKSTTEMQSPQTWTHVLPDSYYGLGISLESRGDLEIRSHNGRNIGFSSYMLWAPEREFAVAVLTNGGEPAEFTSNCVMQAVLDLEPLEPVDYSTDPSTWRSFRGLYLLQGPETERILIYVAPGRDRLYAAIAAAETPWDFEIVEGHQLALNTFFLDLDGDGAPNSSEVITFARPNVSSRKGSMWILNELLVGPRLVRGRSRERSRRSGSARRQTAPMAHAAESLAAGSAIDE